MRKVKRTSISLIQSAYILFFTFGLLNSTFAYSNTVTDKRAKIATMICLEIAETKKFESARRVRLVNEFRINADLELFVEGDEKLIEYYEAGLCETLLLGNEIDLKLALENIYRAAEKQNRARELINMSKAFAQYEKELSNCIPPSKKVITWVRRDGPYVRIGVRWAEREFISKYSTPVHPCIKNYSFGMSQQEALAQRVLYYMVELEGHEGAMLFSGTPLGDKYLSRIGFGYKFNNFDDPYWGLATSLYDPEFKLGKKLKKKSLKKVNLVLAGDIAGYASASQKMDLFGEGRKITKVVYEKK